MVDHNVFVSRGGRFSAFLAAVACDLLAPDWSKSSGRAGSMASGPLVIVGTACLVFDLEAVSGSRGANFTLWQPLERDLVGRHNSVGFHSCALLYAAALNEISFVGRYAKKYVRHLEIIGSILAVSTAGYTGVLIAVVNGVPFWNTPVMPVLFLASAVSTGLAVAMIARQSSISAPFALCRIRTRTRYIPRHRSGCAMLFIFMFIDTLC